MAISCIPAATIWVGVWSLDALAPTAPCCVAPSTGTNSVETLMFGCLAEWLTNRVQLACCGCSPST
eukprot:CAMPEP_0115837724 /NCGR_PEP_ID=MMETSP0287-20121206/5364_1 /TAXON_ID=412157 /ORGANISM="Chrysochromulina rotalis, Strain UIO044" /LENGTH=65 /DNA_ID=CAMNT_0003291235 /DNA_START=136 /DNA_END=333 /DNA_ORIENTATION=-